MEEHGGSSNTGTRERLRTRSRTAPCRRTELGAGGPTTRVHSVTGQHVNTGNRAVTRPTGAAIRWRSRVAESGAPHTALAVTRERPQAWHLMVTCWRRIRKKSPMSS